jgi:hypothetical protein
MTTASEAIQSVISPLLPNWRIQFGLWDEGTSDAERYAVIKPAGGAKASLVRRPEFTVLLIGGMNDSRLLIADFADRVVEAMRTQSGGVVLLQAGEPSFMGSGGGRPVFEFAVSAIAN